MHFDPMKRLQSWLVPVAPGANLIGGGAAGAAQRKRCARQEARNESLPPRVACQPVQTQTTAAASARSEPAPVNAVNRRSSFSPSSVSNARPIRDTSVIPEHPVRPQDGIDFEQIEVDHKPAIPASPLEREQLARVQIFFKSLDKNIEQRSDALGNVRTLSDRQRKKAAEGFAQIRDHLAKFEDQTKPETNARNALDVGGDRSARECSKAIWKICKNMPKNVLKDSDQDDFFQNLGYLCWELKRFHHTRAIDHAAKAYATATAHNMGRICPGMARSRPTSGIKQSIEGGLTARASAIPGLFSFGPLASYRYRQEKDNPTDDDGDNLTLDIRTHTWMAGVQAKFLGAPGSWGHHGSHFLSLSCIGRIFSSKGNYFDHKDLISSQKAQAGRDANDWQFINRSGSQDSLGSRFVAMMRAPRKRLTRHRLGNLYQDPGPLPNICQKKSAKGAFNQDLVQSLGKQLFNIPGELDTNTSDALNACYLPVFTQLQALSIPTTSTEPTSQPPLNPLIALAPLPSPGNLMAPEKKNSISRIGAGFQMTATANSTDFAEQNGGQARLAGNLSLTGEILQNELNVMKFIPPHRQLDPHYSCSAQKSQQRLDEFEHQYRGHPQGHLFGKVKQLLDSGLSRGNSDERLNTAARLDAENSAVKTVHQHSLDLVRLAGMLHSINDKKSGRFTKEEMQNFEADFSRFSKEIFGTDRNPEQLRKFAQKLRRDPQYFMIKSYDAISISLGQIGVHIHETKKNAPVTAVGSTNRISMLHDAREQLERNYTHATAVMDAFLLPMDQETAMRAMSIVPPSLSLSTSFAANADVNVGMFSSFLGFIKGNSGDPTSVVSPGTSSNSVLGKMGDAALAAIGASVTVFHRHAKTHPNPVRAGFFDQVKVGLRGEGLLGPAVEASCNLARGIFKKVKYKLKFKEDSTSDDEHNSSKKFLNDAVNLFTNSAVAVHAKEKEVTWGLRRPLPVHDFIYEKETQWVRVTSRTSNALSASIGVPLHAAHVPMTISGSLYHQETSSSVVFEAMGKCLGYQIIQLDSICKVLDACKRSKRTPHHIKGTLDVQAMRNFLSPSTTEKGPQDLIDGAFACNKYFGTNDTVFGLMENYLTYLDAPRSWNGAPRRGISKRNEFHRFDDNPAFWQTIKSMKSAQNCSGLAAKEGQNRDSYIEARTAPDGSDDPRPVPKDIGRLKRAMHEMKSALDNPNLTAQERMKMFINDDMNSNGRIIFETYIEVLKGYSAINNGVKATTTYQSVVRPPEKLPT